MKRAKKLMVVPELSGLTFEAAVQQMHALLRDESSTQWKIGQLYNYIVDNKLAEQNGHRYVREFFAREFEDVPRSSLTLYSSVARAFTEVVSQTYGVTKLGRLLTYLKLSNQGPIEGDPGDFTVTLPQLDGSTLSKRFADCTRQDLVAAIRALRLSPTLPAADLELLERLQQALMEKLGEETQATIKGTWSGSETEISLTHVPLAQLREVVALLGSIQG